MRKKLLTVGALLAALAVSAQTSTLQVIHNSADPLANLVDIYVNGQLFSDDFEFRKASEVTTVPSNTLLNIGVAPGNSSSVADTLKNFPFTLEDGKHYVLIANGELAGSGKQALSIFAYDQGRIDALAGGTDLLVFHGSTDAPGVDITLENGTLLNDPGTANVELGDFRGYVNLPVNNYSIQVRVAGTNTVVKGYEVPLQTLGTEGLALTVIASGYLNATENQEKFGLFAVTKGGDVIELPVSKSKIQIIHNSADAGAVDIYLNKFTKLSDVDFRTATGYIEVEAGVNNQVAIALAGSDNAGDAPFSYNVSFGANRNYQIFANGLLAGENESAFGLYTIEDTKLASEEGVDVKVFHGVTDAPAVDVTLEDGTVLFGGAAYGDATGYLNLDENDYSIQVRVAGTNTVVKGYEAVLKTLGLEGNAITVFASGLLGATGDQPKFGLFAVTAAGDVVALPVSMAKVQIIHNSANAGIVDIYLNEETKLEGVDFRTATGYIEVEAGVVNKVSIAPEGSSSADDALVDYEISFAANSASQVFANGLVGDNDLGTFDLYKIEGTRLNSIGGVDLKVFHGVTDAPAVDVTLEDGTVLFGDLAYTNATEYLNLDENDYSIQVRVAGTNTVVKGYEAVLKTLGLEGNAITVFASGLLGATGDEPKFGLFAVTAAGDVVALPVSMAKIQIVHNSPDAGAVDIYLNKDTKLSDVGFRAATGYIDVEAGVNNAVDIALAGSASADDAVFNYEVPFAANTNYTIFANGLVANAGQANGFDLLAIENTKCDAAENTTDVIVLHASPNAPAVNVTLDNGNLLDASTENVSYNQFTSYLSLSTNDYKLQVRLNADNSVFKSYDAPLQTLGLDEKSIIVFASGLVGTSGATEFGLFALDCEGNVTALPISDPTSANLIKNWGVVYSNPIQNSLRLEVNTDVNYNIFDLSGRLVNNGNLNGGVSNINTTNLSSGTYVVQLTNNKEVVTFKVIKN